MAHVVYDTSSSWLSVTSSLCNLCPLRAYNLSLSKTRSEELTTRDHEKFAGGAEVLGYRVDDKVCI